MNETIHDEQTPLKILHKIGSVALTFPLAIGCSMAWQGTHCCPQLGKGTPRSEGDLWSLHHTVHETQEEVKPGMQDIGSQTSQSRCLTTALCCLEASRGRILRERNDRSHK